MRLATGCCHRGSAYLVGWLRECVIHTNQKPGAESQRQRSRAKCNPACLRAALMGNKRFWLSSADPQFAFGN